MNFCGSLVDTNDYGYKIHAICYLNGVIHNFDLSKALIHNII